MKSKGRLVSAIIAIWIAVLFETWLKLMVDIISLRLARRLAEGGKMTYRKSNEKKIANEIMKNASFPNKSEKLVQ